MTNVMNEVGIDVSGQESKGADGSLSSRLMDAILARENGPRHLMCNKKWVHYYKQFGFLKHVAYSELPSDFAREYRIAKIITGAISLFIAEKLDIVPMKRDKS